MVGAVIDEDGGGQGTPARWPYLDAQYAAVGWVVDAFDLVGSFAVAEARDLAQRSDVGVDCFPVTE